MSEMEVSQEVPVEQEKPKRGRPQKQTKKEEVVIEQAPVETLPEPTPTEPTPEPTPTEDEPMPEESLSPKNTENKSKEGRQTKSQKKSGCDSRRNSTRSRGSTKGGSGINSIQCSDCIRAFSHTYGKPTCFFTSNENQ